MVNTSQHAEGGRVRGHCGFWGAEQSSDAPSSNPGSQLHPCNSIAPHLGSNTGWVQHWDTWSCCARCQRDKEMLELQVLKGQRMPICKRRLSSQFLHNNLFFPFSSQSRNCGRSTVLG